MADSAFYYVVGRQSCPYCVKAKDLLEARQQQVKFRDLEDQRELMVEYTKKYHWDTVPMVFYFDSAGSHHFVGGYSDLVEHLNSSEK